MPLTLNDRLLKIRRTKIIATLGPASSSPEVVELLLTAGVNVFRLNMSHGDHNSHAESYSTIRELATKMALPIAVMVDLSGPKLRVGKFLDGHIKLVQNDSVVVTVENVLGKPGLIPSQYTDLVHDVVPGNRILLDDGILELQVESIKGEEITCRVIHGGILKDHKGINLPGVTVSAPALTEKDKKDALFATHLGADYIALSFVQRASDIDNLRSLLQAKRSNAEIIAKIETAEALQNIDEIIDASDAIMVARGDLGVEISPEDVPAIQDQLILLARTKMKPAIVATQMLESMIKNPKPTRAEVTDVSHAVNCGTDAVMLSAETAAGQYPVQSVQMMDRIARRAEARLWKEGIWGQNVGAVDSQSTFSSAIANATARMSKDLMAHAVLVVCTSSKPARIIGSARPASPIVAITKNDCDYQRLALIWGVIPILHKDSEEENLKRFAKETSMRLKLASPGDCILMVEGFSDAPSQDTSSVTIIKV